MPILTPALTIAAVLTLLPFVAFAFFPFAIRRHLERLPFLARFTAPALLCIPYVLVNFEAGTLHVSWLLVYLLLPVVVALLLHHAARIDPEQKGVWPDFLVLITLGLAVDLRWLEPAWPPRLAIFSKMLLVDAGLWGFFVIRNLHRAGFDLRLRPKDFRRGGINFLLYTPLAVALGLALGFLHVHHSLPEPMIAAGTLVVTFLFVAVPEELFFRGWMQNLLERRLGPNAALAVTSVLFGLSHFNKRAAHFNWRYVLLATLAGVFYGRAWRGKGGRRDHRVAASALTHTFVDTVWSVFLR
jgi:membrane protease YdiL (CAAX protease family)